jgi:DNA-binding response OmpR family regulator
MAARELTNVRIVLASSDLETCEILCHQMQSMSIHIDTCRDLESAGRTFSQKKCEGLVVDLQVDPNSLSLATMLRQSASNRTAVSLAILLDSGQEKSALAAGVTFVLERPLSGGLVSRTLRAAFPLMLAERRRYFRCPIEVPVFVTTGSGSEFQATSINVSVTGIALDSQVRMQAAELLKLRFRLPGDEAMMTVAGKICWAKVTGRVGIQFHSLKPDLAARLQHWLSERFDTLSHA